MRAEVKQEPFSLTQAVPGVVGADGLVDTDAWLPIWEYAVPIGLGLVILGGHTFAAHIEDDIAAPLPATGLVRISVLDASRQDRKTIFGPSLYATLQNFVDRDQIARFNIPEPVKVYENQVIQIEVSHAIAANFVQVADCYFEMAISRVRQPL